MKENFSGIVALGMIVTFMLFVLGILSIVPFIISFALAIACVTFQ